REVYGLWKRAGWQTCCVYLIRATRNLPNVLRSRTLQPVDRAMGGRTYRFIVSPGKAVEIEGDHFAGAREIYCRRVYFALPGFDIGEEDVCVDVGANVDIFTLVAAVCGKKVIAIEAQSEFLPAISSNLQRNNCTNKTIVVLGLVGAKRGLFSKVSERQMASHWRDEPPLISLPDLFARLGIGRVDFLKVDIEGSEFDVFSGDLRWLEMVNRIAMEVHTNFGSVSSLSTTLREAGFRVWLTDARQRAVSTLKSSSGYLFARKEASDRAGRKILA